MELVSFFLMLWTSTILNFLLIRVAVEEDRLRAFMLTMLAVLTVFVLLDRLVIHPPVAVKPECLVSKS